MNNPLRKAVGGATATESGHGPLALRTAVSACFASALLISATGCQTTTAEQSGVYGDPKLTNSVVAQPVSAGKPDVILLREGDSIRISFPGAPTMNTLQSIRRDGRISLPMGLGEIQAAGLTPAELEKNVLRVCGPQLQTKEVSVTVESSAFQVYLTGAVLRPGKIIAERQLTVLEAVMEAGGFDYTKANLKKVRIIRTENGQTIHYTVNLKGVLQGDQADQFKLKPADIIYVPERFSWF